MAETKHTPEQDREYVEYSRSIQHEGVQMSKIVTRYISIIDRLEAEKAVLVEACKTALPVLEDAAEDRRRKNPYEVRLLKAVLAKTEPTKPTAPEQTPGMAFPGLETGEGMG